MSHVINVLKALSRKELSFSHDNWIEHSTGGQFFDVYTKPGLISGDFLKAFIVSPACGWGGLTAQTHTLPDGKQTVVGSEGFINLLLSIEADQEGSCLFSFMNGNEHSILSMVQHPKPYDFCLPWREDLSMEPGYQPISYSVVRGQMEQALRGSIGSLVMARIKLPLIRLVHVLPPPPISSNEQIMRTPEIFRDQFLKYGITPISIRVKYYLLLVEVLRRALEPYRVEIIESPRQASNENGALKDEYAFAATHANVAYGNLVAQQIKAQSQPLENTGI
jgi:hypothetical protein